MTEDLYEPLDEDPEIADARMSCGFTTLPSSEEMAVTGLTLRVRLIRREINALVKDLMSGRYVDTADEAAGAAGLIARTAGDLTALSESLARATMEAQ